MKEKQGVLSLKTQAGCLRLLALFVGGVLLFSFCAALISSNFGKTKISHLKVDVRGAELDMDLYVPAGTSDADSLPCVVLGHGRGATKNVVRGIAEEFSRRGYVVLNVNAYGMGLSEQPVSDEAKNGAEQFIFGSSPHGLYDAVQYARSLTYVDATRIALLGHSFGSSRSSTAAVMDCGYYTLNDRLINILADVFQQQFTAEEILQDADKLAADRLNKDQLLYYESLRSAEEELYNTRVNTIVLTGATGGPAPSTVLVAGHEVQRECQTNITFIPGKYDSLGAGRMWNADGTTSILGEPLKKTETWYSVTSDGTQYTEIGALGTTSDALTQAFKTRGARIVCFNAESHSKQYFSSATAKDAVQILQTAFAYNGGELTGAAQPIEAGNTIWWLRAVFNLAAMMCMIASLFPLVGLLLTAKFFSPCVMDQPKAAAQNMSKLMYWLFAAVTVVWTIIALFQANSGGPTWANPFGKKLPSVFHLVSTSAIALWFVVWLAGGALVILAVKFFIAKKASKEPVLKHLNIHTNAGVAAKTILIGIICITFANALLITIERLFNQDFRFWQMMFTEMKIEHWLVALPYVLLFLVMYLIIGASINYDTQGTFTGWKETAFIIVVNSLGVWLLCLFCYIMWFVNWTGAAISDFTLSYSMLLFVPVTVYITRKLFKMTNSVWLGACVNAILLAWSLVSSAGTADMYYGQGIISIIFGV